MNLDRHNAVTAQPDGQRSPRRTAIKRWLVRLAIALAALVAGLVGLAWSITYHPADLEALAVDCPAAPLLARGQQVKVMTWNVQYMAGKNHVFWYDLPDNDGPDERPTPQEIATTLGEVARVIREEQPDVILLQEVDVGADRTDGEDQVARLRALLPAEYACEAQAYYWKAAYVPHPRVHGSAAMVLVTLSKYAISDAQRHQLALLPNDPLTRQFNPKRAILETRLPIDGGGSFVAFNTHLEAFAAGTTTMQDEVAEVDAVLAERSGAGLPWVIGGDFNMLPPDPAAYARLSAPAQRVYNPTTEITPLFEHYAVAPSLSDLTGPEYRRWFTHIPNQPGDDVLDRTIDYVMSPKSLPPTAYAVRQRDTQQISDHLPLIAEYRLP